MSLKEWLTQTLYVTQPQDPDPFFRPRLYGRPKEEVLEKLKMLVGGLPGWKVLEVRENQGRLHAEHRSFWGGAQDVNFYVVQGLDGITRLEATSQSRTGKGDFGQNKRNLKEILAQLDGQIPPEKP